MKFSANLGFLWTDRSLIEAIHAAHAAGFDAVECHWPYQTAASEVRDALTQTDLQMLGLNTLRGDLAAGENGLSALPGREDEACAAIDLAIRYATEIDASAIHVMAGFAKGADAAQTFQSNLAYACEEAAKVGKTILIEPLNRHDAPEYFLQTTDQAAGIIADVGADNLKLMFDCYHVGRTEGDLTFRLHALKDLIGHIQFASIPTRGRPDQGEVDYGAVFAAIDAMGWAHPLGAEYKPVGDTDASLGWLKKWS